MTIAALLADTALPRQISSALPPRAAIARRRDRRPPQWPTHFDNPRPLVKGRGRSEFRCGARRCHSAISGRYAPYSRVFSGGQRSLGGNRLLVTASFSLTPATAYHILTRGLVNGVVGSPSCGRRPKGRSGRVVVSSSHALASICGTATAFSSRHLFCGVSCGGSGSNRLLANSTDDCQTVWSIILATTTQATAPTIRSGRSSFARCGEIMTVTAGLTITRLRRSHGGATLAGSAVAILVAAFRCRGRADGSRGRRQKVRLSRPGNGRQGRDGSRRGLAV